MSEDITWTIDGKNYIVQVEGDKLVAYIEYDGKKELVKEPNDLMMVEFILDQLVPDKEKSRLVGEITIDDNLYDIFLDEDRCLYSFYQKVNGKYKLPSREVLEILNYQYNHVDEASNIVDDIDNVEVDSPNKEWNSKNLGTTNDDIDRIVIIDNKKSKRVRRLIKVTSGVLAVSLSVGALGALPDSKRWKIDYVTNGIVHSLKHSFKDEVDFDKSMVKDALDDNPNLTDEEKEFLEGLDKVIEENIEYLDIDNVLKNIRELKIVKTDVSSKGNFGETIASYISAGSRKNTIYLRPLFFQLSKAEQKTALFHEVCHAICNQFVLTNMPSPIGEYIQSEAVKNTLRVSLLEELVNELFAREYYIYLTNEVGEFKGYTEYMPAVYALAEIIDSEVLREYKCTNDARVIIDALVAIDGDYDRAYKLITMFNTLKVYTSLENEDKNIQKENIRGTLLEIGEIIKYYYETKMNRKIDSDLVMGLYFYRSHFFSDDNMDNVVREEFKIEQGNSTMFVTPKSYLAKEGPSAFRVSVICNNQVSTYDVDDNMRYVDSSKNFE